jgi:hypothetical protein
MHSCKRTNIVLVLMTTLSTTLIIGLSLPNQVVGQMNGTQQQNQTDYTGFHSNVEQIIGHIEKAEENKISNNDTLTLGHALHPIEEVLTLITIPLSTTDNNLNDTYFRDLYHLSALASSGNSTVDEFNDKTKSSIELSNKVITTVIPATVLGTTEHNVSVIKDLLTISGSEYKEGVSGGDIILELEYQDGSAFIDRAYTLFNNTQNISNDTQTITVLLSHFANLTDSVQNLHDPSIIDQIIQEINMGLSPKDNSTTSIDSPTQTSQDYIATIRGLLNEVITAHESNDKTKAKELATTAYLDNFEYIEAPIGKELSDRGEALLREKLREQIDGNASIEELKENIAEINRVLDEAATFLGSNPQ